MTTMTIGALASAARVPARTIRFYEQKGILPAAGRSPSGYRLYGLADLRRLRLARQARSLGFSLTEVRDILRLAEHEHCRSFQGNAAHRVVRKLAEVDAAIERLRETRQTLEESLVNLHGGDCQQAVLECEECKCLGT